MTTSLVSEAEVWLGLFIVMGSIAAPTLFVVVRDVAGSLRSIRPATGGLRVRVLSRIHGRPRPRPTMGASR